MKKAAPYLCEGLERPQINDLAVLDALSRVPRHLFVPEEYQSEAFADRALPIGKDQTISQPFIVALMTQEARIGEGSKVLEIGAGSGYQSAVLAELGAKVFSIEIIPELAEQARERLTKLGYISSGGNSRVTLRCGDGWAGWVEEAPFDAILIAAAAPIVPQPLVAQLTYGGRLIMPIESEKLGPKEQSLIVVQRTESGITSREIGSVRFVPMTGEVRIEDDGS